MDHMWSILIQINFYQNTLHSRLDRPLLGPSTFHGLSILYRQLSDQPKIFVKICGRCIGEFNVLHSLSLNMANDTPTLDGQTRC